MLFCLCSDSARVANYLYHFAGLWRRHCLHIWEGVFWNLGFDGDELGVKGVFERFYCRLVSVAFCFTYIFVRTFDGTMMISQNSIDLCWCGTCFWLGHTNNITHQAPIIKHHTSNIFYQISLNKYHSSNIAPRTKHHSSPRNHCTILFQWCALDRIIRVTLTKTSWCAAHAKHNSYFC